MTIPAFESPRHNTSLIGLRHSRTRRTPYEYVDNSEKQRVANEGIFAQSEKMINEMVDDFFRFVINREKEKQGERSFEQADTLSSLLLGPAKYFGEVLQNDLLDYKRMRFTTAAIRAHFPDFVKIVLKTIADKARDLRAELVLEQEDASLGTLPRLDVEQNIIARRLIGKK